MKFGTDGLRGRAGTEITVDVAWRVGRAAASTLGGRVVVARDTRPSGPELEDAVLAGIVAAGGTALRAGVLPTPGLSVLVAQEGADAGVMITASHNPAHDNGLKVLGRGGAKLEARARAALETALVVDGVGAGRSSPQRVVPCADPLGRYARAVLDALPEHVRGRAWLAGHTVVVDAANGAGAGVAADVLRATGARVVSIADGGGGSINHGVGAVHPEAMAVAVGVHGAGVGLALDGDGDRVVLADARGRLVDGDAVLYILAHGPVAVGTVMSNAGCERALAARGTRLVRAPVGDANVADAMRAHAADIGAEPSGHVLFSDGLPTGCGLLAGLRTLAGTLGRGRALDEALADYRPTFQAHAVAPRQPLDVLAAAIAALEADGARVVARPSGTEPVVRLMVEHAEEARARGGLDTLVSILGAST